MLLSDTGGECVGLIWEPSSSFSIIFEDATLFLHESWFPTNRL